MLNRKQKKKYSRLYNLKIFLLSYCSRKRKKIGFFPYGVQEEIYG